VGGVGKIEEGGGGERRLVGGGGGGGVVKSALVGFTERTERHVRLSMTEEWNKLAVDGMPTSQ